MGHPYRTSCPPDCAARPEGGPLDMICAALAVGIVAFACIAGQNAAPSPSPPPPAPAPWNTKTVVVVYHCDGEGPVLDCRVVDAAPYPKRLASAPDATRVAARACR